MGWRNEMMDFESPWATARNPYNKYLPGIEFSKKHTISLLETCRILRQCSKGAVLSEGNVWLMATFLI